MDLENIWQQAGSKDDILNRILQQKNFDHLHSKLPLKKLKKNLLSGIAWAILITAGYLVLFYFIHIWQVYVALSIVIAFNIWIIILTWRLYKTIQDTITPSNSLKQELQKNYDGFQKWWAVQARLGLYVYPVAATGGFMLGGVVGSGKTVEAFLYRPSILIILAITIAIITPLCYYLSKWMFKYAYGRHLKKLKELIDELN